MAENLHSPTGGDTTHGFAHNNSDNTQREIGPTFLGNHSNDAHVETFQIFFGTSPFHCLHKIAYINISVHFCYFQYIYDAVTRL